MEMMYPPRSFPMASGDGIPLRQGAGTGSRLVFGGYRGLRQRNSRSSFCSGSFRVQEYIWVQGVRRWTSGVLTRQGARPGGVSAPPTLVGPSLLHRRTSSSYIYPCTPKTSISTIKNYFHRRNLLYPRDPILEPSPALRWRGNRQRRASTSSPRPLQ